MSNIPDGWKQVSFKRNAKSREQSTLEPSTTEAKEENGGLRREFCLRRACTGGQRGRALPWPCICDNGLQEQFDIEQVLEENDRDQARAITDNIKKKIQSGAERSHAHKAESHPEQGRQSCPLRIGHDLSMINYKRVLRGVDSHMLTHNNDIRTRFQTNARTLFFGRRSATARRSCIPARAVRVHVPGPHAASGRCRVPAAMGG